MKAIVEKGATIRTAIGHARGEYAIIQDADLEYDPKDYPNLLRPLPQRQADAVFGSRFMIVRERRVLSPLDVEANIGYMTLVLAL